MRRLITLGLAACLVSPAAAQTEIIVRRPGHADEVIRIDSASAKAALATAQAGLEALRIRLRDTTSAKAALATAQAGLEALRVRLRDTTSAKAVLATAQAAAGMLQRQVQELQGKFEKMQPDLAPLRLNTLALGNGAITPESLLGPAFRSLAAALRQPHFGIVVVTQPRETDRYGAYIQAVTPGSPADKAGIMSGDIITRIAGKSLTEKDPKDNSGPGVRLISIIATLTVGKPVDVELRRGTESKTVKVTPDESEAGTIALTAPGLDISRLPLQRPGSPLRFREEQPRALDLPSFNVFGPENGGFGYALGNDNLFASYELAPLNPKLGAYFGTSEGVLIVSTDAIRGGFSVAAPAQAPARSAAPRPVRPVPRISRDTAAIVATMSCDTTMLTNAATIQCTGTAPASTTSITLNGVQSQDGFWRRAAPPPNLGLEPGDVILSVDGRKVTTPSQLMRIVGSYDHNDEFKLQIMRQKHTETVAVKMP